MGEPNTWWNWNFTTTILGGLLAGLVGVVLFFIQECKKDKKENKENLAEDSRNLYEILDYLNYLKSTLEEHQKKEQEQNASPSPCHITLPFKKEIKLISNHKEFHKIRSNYNTLALKIYEMETFLAIQGDPAKWGIQGYAQIAKTHAQLQKEVLGKTKELIEEINATIKYFENYPT
jgi:hypothetical protein